jgi:transcriptional regulator of acetoin/glycerol metabolism
MLHALRRERKRSAVLALMARHRGNIASAARELGVTPATLDTKIRRLGLWTSVLALRPPRLTPKEERALLLEVVRRHQGQIWKARQELGMPKSTFLLRLRKYDLYAEADALRVEAHLTGPRTRLPLGRDPGQRRAWLVALLDSCGWNVARAAGRAGVSDGTMYNMLHRHQIDWVACRQQRLLHRLVDALRMGRGVIAATARHMGVQERTVRRWCTELDVDPRDYRPR